MSAEHPPVSAAEPPVRTSLRLIWLAGLVYAVAAATHPGGSGRHLVLFRARSTSESIAISF